MNWPSLDESFSLHICLLTVACNREIQHIFIFCILIFLLAIRCEKKKTSGSGSKFNCGVGSGRVGSDDLGYRLGSGFSLKPVQTSTPNTQNNDL